MKIREFGNRRGLRKCLTLGITALVLAVAVTAWAWQKSGNNFFYTGGRIFIGVEAPTSQHTGDANAYLQVHNPEANSNNFEVARFTAKVNEGKMSYITVGDAVLDRKGTQGYLAYGPTTGQWFLGTHFYSPTLSVQSMGQGGNVGIGLMNPSQPLHLKSGAYVSQGGVWTNASSREYKENIEKLSAEQALAALRELTPVTFQYKAARDEKHVGFIAEEAPAILASADRKGLSSMDVAAVLTKVIQEQEKTILAQQEALSALAARVNALEQK